MGRDGTGIPGTMVAAAGRPSTAVRGPSAVGPGPATRCCIVDHGVGPYRGAVSESVLLIAHGSRNPAAQADHERLCERVGVAAGVPVRPAYLELAEPGITAAIDAAVAGGAERVRLVPVFLHSGNHVARDIPEAVAAARAAHPGVTIELDEHVGADPALVDLIAARI